MATKPQLVSGPATPTRPWKTPSHTSFIGALRFTPTQLTRMSGSPNAPTTSSATVRTPSRVLRSPLTQAARPPCASSSPTVEARLSRLRATTTTLAPARAIAPAMARPIPELPPVTTATRPSKANSWERYACEVNYAPYARVLQPDLHLRRHRPAAGTRFELVTPPWEVPPSGRRTVDRIRPDMSDDRANKAVFDFVMAWAVCKDSYSASSFPEIPPPNRVERGRASNKHRMDRGSSPRPRLGPWVAPTDCERGGPDDPPAGSPTLRRRNRSCHRLTGQRGPPDEPDKAPAGCRPIRPAPGRPCPTIAHRTKVRNPPPRVRTTPYRPPCLVVLGKVR